MMGWERGAAVSEPENVPVIAIGLGRLCVGYCGK
jgi:hypothetical protein